MKWDKNNLHESKRHFRKLNLEIRLKKKTLDSMENVRLSERNRHAIGLLDPIKTCVTNIKNP